MCMIIHMRTNIDIDNDLYEKAARLSDAKTKRAVIHEALAEYVAAKTRSSKIEEYQRRVEEIQRKTADFKPTIDAADLIRADRDSR